MSNLDLASRMLGHVERGFRKAHGPGLERLTALKGDHCAENLLYVRLHLLQASVAMGFRFFFLLRSRFVTTPMTSKLATVAPKKRDDVNTCSRRKEGPGKPSGRACYLFRSEWCVPTVYTQPPRRLSWRWRMYGVFDIYITVIFQELLLELCNCGSVHSSVAQLSPGVAPACFRAAATRGYGHRVYTNTSDASDFVRCY